MTTPRIRRAKPGHGPGAPIKSQARCAWLHKTPLSGLHPCRKVPPSNALLAALTRRQDNSLQRAAASAV